MTEPSQAARSEGIPDTPPGYPTADPAAVERARTDRGLRLRFVRALWSRDELPTPYAKIGGYIYEIADRAASEIEGRPAAGSARCCELHNSHCEPPSELCCHGCSEARHPEHPPGVVCVPEQQARAGEPLEALQEAEQHLAQILGTRWQPAPWETSSKSEFLRELSQLLQGMRDGINRARRPEPEPRVHEPMRAEDVPDEWIRLALINYFNDGRENLADFAGDDVRAMEDAVAAVLPKARRRWFEELFGTREEIDARAAEPLSEDDLTALCERSRPGEHERRVRSEIRDLWEAWQKADQRRKTDVDNGVFDRAVIDAANRCRYRLERALGVEVPETTVEAARALGWEQT